MARRPRLVEDSVVLVDGPWSHRDVSANGIRMHVAEAGTGPLVVLLHSFPEFWWAWRHQLTGLAEAGCRVVPPALRGDGGARRPWRRARPARVRRERQAAPGLRRDDRCRRHRRTHPSAGRT